MYFTYMGLRPGAVELLSLTWASVQWDHGVISVTAATKGKSRRPRARHVPIHPALKPMLQQWHAADGGAGWVVHYKHRQVKKLQTTWENTLKRAGIDRRIRLYDIRHVFVTQALEAGADPKALSDIVGSRAETLIKHYQHVTRQMHRAAMDKIPALGLGDTAGDTSKISPKDGLKK